VDKKAIVFCVVAAVLLMIPGLSFGQEAGHVERSYGRGRVIMKNLTRYDARGIRFSTDTLVFRDAKTGTVVSVPLAEVETVSHKKGQALLGGLAGGGLMLASALLAVGEAESDPNLELKDNAGTIVVGLTVGGVVIGALIGSAVTDEKTVWEKGRFRVSLAVPLTIQATHGGAEVSLARVALAF
jgi:hypothetical protein